MKDPVKYAITILDFVLIYMTAYLLLIAMSKQYTPEELVYNFVYVILNISTLILNVVVLYRDKKSE